MKLPILATQPAIIEQPDAAMPTNPIVGIAGLKGSGKSTLLYAIKKRVHRHVSVYPFAGPLKDIAFEMGWDGEKDEDGRRLLQLLGTECGRECIHPDVWVGKWEDTIMPDLHNGHVIMVDDVRFANEVGILQELGGILIKVTRPGQADKRRWWQVRAPRAHPSEMPPADKHFHFLFDNDGTKDDIGWFAEFVAKQINERWPCSTPTSSSG